MRLKLIIYILIAAFIVIYFGLNDADAAFSAELGSPNLNFRISDYKPAPANVHIHNDNGRPYYIERDRRVYMEKKHHGKNNKKEKKHHEDNGRKKGHDKH